MRSGHENEQSPTLRGHRGAPPRPRAAPILGCGPRFLAGFDILMGASFAYAHGALWLDRRERGGARSRAAELSAARGHAALERGTRSTDLAQLVNLDRAGCE